MRQKARALSTELQPKEKADTLVLYVFSNTDDEYLPNLMFFLRHGVQPGDGCDYVIVIQTGGTSKVSCHPRKSLCSHVQPFSTALLSCSRSVPNFRSRANPFLIPCSPWTHCQRRLQTSDFYNIQMSAMTGARWAGCSPTNWWTPTLTRTSSS